VTTEHPFWVDGQGWVNANQLQKGYRVTSVDGKFLAIQSVVPSSQLQDTYNFEVADYHTYFVGNSGAWVHNACKTTPAKQASGMGGKLVKKFKDEGAGQGAGRSGGHGTPYKRAGAELTRQANKLGKNDPLRKALKAQGKKLVEKGKSINHT